MKACFVSLGKFLKADLLSSDDLKSAIKFLAVMQQGDHELYGIALKVMNQIVNKRTLKSQIIVSLSFSYATIFVKIKLLGSRVIKHKFKYTICLFGI